MREKVSILLVDDDDAVRRLARVILEHEGWQVLEAGSVHKAADSLKEGGFRPHIAIVDLLLPDGLGTELAVDVRRVRNKSQVIYITGDPGGLRRLNSMHEAVLAKPFTPAELVAAVRAALETMKPVVVFVEPGIVYRRLILAALKPAGVEVAMAAAFEEGLVLARQREAAVLVTPPPSGECALAALLDLRRAAPRLEVVALDTEDRYNDYKWFDSRLSEAYSVQGVSDAVRLALNRREKAVDTP